mgnify:CR=1 FL=1
MAKQGALSALGKGGMSELWARLRFLFLAIIVYRIGAHIPVPGINPDRLADLFRQNEGTILSLFNMFSGGALERISGQPPARRLPGAAFSDPERR